MGTPEKNKNIQKEIEYIRDNKNNFNKLPSWVLIVSVTSALIFLIIILTVSLFIPNPTTFQFFVFRVVLSLAAAAFGATIPGFLKIEMPLWGKGLISAGGALALFVLVYYVNPIALEEKTNHKKEAIKIFNDRANSVIHKLSPHIGVVPEVEAAMGRFKALHNSYIEAYENDENIRAHDILKEIYILLSDLEKEEKWKPYGEEKPILAMLYNSKVYNIPPNNTASAQVSTEKQVPPTIKNSIGMEFVKIPTKNFYMQTTEVTQWQWEKIMDYNPSKYKNCGYDCPVESVRWDEVEGYIEKLNKIKGKNYRLPTAKEWEYACNSKQNTIYFSNNNSTDYAWYAENSQENPKPVALLLPNNFGLYDMHGNVWEWCQDETNFINNEKGVLVGNGRIIHGGSFHSPNGFCKDKIKCSIPSSSSYGRLGFRLVLPVNNQNNTSRITFDTNETSTLNEDMNDKSTSYVTDISTLNEDMNDKSTSYVTDISTLNEDMNDKRKPGLSPVFMINRTKGIIKARCLEVLGRYDAFPHYECYDKDGNLKPFDLEDKWEALPLKKICFRHTVKDTVKNCVFYQLKKDGKPRYMCLDEEGKKYVSFKADGQWQLLKEDDTVCMEREFGPDMIREFEFEI